MRFKSDKQYSLIDGKKYLKERGYGVIGIDTDKYGDTYMIGESSRDFAFVMIKDDYSVIYKETK